jgi:hypothetical protein
MGPPRAALKEGTRMNEILKLQIHVLEIVKRRRDHFG